MKLKKLFVVALLGLLISSCASKGGTSSDFSSEESDISSINESFVSDDASGDTSEDTSFSSSTIVSESWGSIVFWDNNLNICVCVTRVIC